MLRKETTFNKLKVIADIEDAVSRKEALRQALISDNVLAIVVQRTYHPNYNFDLPKESIPTTVRKSNHDEPGPFLQSLKKWDILRVAEEVPYNSGIARHIKETQFANLYEAVASEDADLLVGVKDKKLPWDSLNVEFVVDAIPELFPDSFRPNTTDKVDAKPVDKVVTTTEAAPASEFEIQLDPSKGSTKQQCLWIMQNNPGLKRKEYLELFKKLGIKQATAAIYYQDLKDKV